MLYSNATIPSFLHNDQGLGGSLNENFYHYLGGRVAWGNESSTEILESSENGCDNHLEQEHHLYLLDRESQSWATCSSQASVGHPIWRRKKPDYLPGSSTSINVNLQTDNRLEVKNCFCHYGPGPLNRCDAPKQITRRHKEACPPASPKPRSVQMARMLYLEPGIILRSVPLWRLVHQPIRISRYSRLLPSLAFLLKHNPTVISLLATLANLTPFTAPHQHFSNWNPINKEILLGCAYCTVLIPMADIQIQNPASLFQYTLIVLDYVKTRHANGCPGNECTQRLREIDENVSIAESKNVMLDESVEAESLQGCSMRSSKSRDSLSGALFSCSLCY